MSQQIMFDDRDTYGPYGDPTMCFHVSLTKHHASLTSDSVQQACRQLPIQTAIAPPATSLCTADHAHSNETVRPDAHSTVATLGCSLSSCASNVSTPHKIRFQRYRSGRSYKHRDKRPLDRHARQKLRLRHYLDSRSFIWLSLRYRYSRQYPRMARRASIATNISRR